MSNKAEDAGAELHIAPNRPLTLALLDPEGRFDFETGMGQYQTTTGEPARRENPSHEPAIIYREAA